MWEMFPDHLQATPCDVMSATTNPLCDCKCLPLSSSFIHLHIVQGGADSQRRRCLCRRCCGVQIDRQDLVHTQQCQSFSPSVMHYRPPLYFADLGLSSGLNLLRTRTHARCDHTDLWLAERDLISNMGLSRSTLPPSLPQSVLMWLGLNTASCSLFSLSSSLTL